MTISLHRFVPRLSVVLAPFALSLLSACATDVAPADVGDEAVGETTSALLTSNWSALPSVGSPVQSAWRGGAMATLSGTTYLVHSGGSPDATNLYWSKLTASGWTTNLLIPNQFANSQVSLAAFGNSLYLFHSGKSDSTAVWVSRFNPATETWSTNFKIAHTSRGTPAITAYRGSLYVVGIRPSDSRMWMATMSASEVFSGQTILPGVSTSRGAIAVHGGELYLVRRAGSSTSIVYDTFNGARWSGERYLPAGPGGAPLQASEVSLAPQGNDLHLVHRRPDSNTVWWTYTVGSSWAPEVTLGSLASVTVPTIATDAAGIVLVTTVDQGTCWITCTDDRSRPLFFSRYTAPLLPFPGRPLPPFVMQ